MDPVLELEIDPGTTPGEFTVRVARSVAGGEPTARFTLDVDALLATRQQLESVLLASSVSARRILPAAEVSVQSTGATLFDAIFVGEVAATYRASRAVAADRGRGLQVRLRLGAPGLAALPWEMLYDRDSQAYLCRQEPLVRQVEGAHPPSALAIKPPLQVLAVVSSPRGLQPLDVAVERAHLEEALAQHVRSGRVRLEWVEHASWEELHDRLLRRPWHVLHFIGHGTFDDAADEGLIALVGSDGRADFVNASSLADLLHEASPTPRLVVLNSCESGASSSDDPFSGTAAALARSGIQSVAAMQFTISDRAALAFARGFYTALANGRTIDEAMRSGRIGILGLGRGTLEWVTPVLYVQRPRHPALRRRRPAPLPRRSCQPRRPWPSPQPAAVTRSAEPSEPSREPAGPSEPVRHRGSRHRGSRHRGRQSTDEADTEVGGMAAVPQAPGTVRRRRHERGRPRASRTTARRHAGGCGHCRILWSWIAVVVALAALARSAARSSTRRARRRRSRRPPRRRRSQVRAWCQVDDDGGCASGVRCAPGTDVSIISGLGHDRGQRDQYHAPGARRSARRADRRRVPQVQRRGPPR